MSAENEIWKDVVGYEGLFKVSNIGRVMCCELGEQKILTHGYSLGYCIVHFKGGSHRVHRLVAKAFIPNPENKREVNHIDSNRSNPRVENLEWVTPSENMAHAYKVGANRSLRKRTKESYEQLWNSFRKPVIQYSLSGEFIKEWEGIVLAAKELKISGISHCCRKVNKTAGGYVWKYKD
jgi:hypothetical protein